jgi:hypothetical protein
MIVINKFPERPPILTNYQQVLPTIKISRAEHPEDARTNMAVKMHKPCGGSVDQHCSAELAYRCHLRDPALVLVWPSRVRPGQASTSLIRRSL